MDMQFSVYMLVNLKDVEYNIYGSPYGIISNSLTSYSGEYIYYHFLCLDHSYIFNL